MSRDAKNAQAKTSFVRAIQQRMYLSNMNIITLIGDHMFSKWLSQPWYDVLTDEISAQIIGNDIIDVGCGPGELLFKLKEKNPDCAFTGIDVSKSVLKKAEKRARRYQYEQLEFLYTNGHEIPVEKRVYTYGLSTFSFHLWQRPVMMLNEIYRILCENAVFSLIDFNGAERDEVENIAYLLNIAEQAPWGIKHILKNDINWGYKIVGLYDSNELEYLIDRSSFSKFTIATRPLHGSPEDFLVEATLYK